MSEQDYIGAGYDGYDPSEPTTDDLPPVSLAAFQESAYNAGANQMRQVMAEQQQQQQAFEVLRESQKIALESDKLLAEAFPQWNYPQPLGETGVEARPVDLSNAYLTKYKEHIDEAAANDPQQLAVARYKAFELAEADEIERLQEKKALDDSAAFSRIKAAHRSYSTWRDNPGSVHDILDQNR